MSMDEKGAKDSGRRMFGAIEMEPEPQVSECLELLLNNITVNK